MVDVEILESSHSIDVINTKVASKYYVVDACKRRMAKTGKADFVLCIGDKGKWPGNDYELLATEFALSVDQISILPSTSWNLSSFGKRNDLALLEYLSKLKIEGSYMKYSI